MTKKWIASFDIGHRNLCFAIEEIDTNMISHLKPIKKSQMYNEDGTLTTEGSLLIKEIYTHSKTVYFKNKDLTNKTIKNLTPEVFHLLTDHLDEYSELWDKCSIFLIEKQMAFGKICNIKALKLGQHCFSYFAFKYNRFKTILEYPAYHKTQVLGAPKKAKIKKGKTTYTSVDKPTRKKWAIEKARSILIERDDFETLSKIESSSKKDDISDCILQAISSMYIIFVEKAPLE